MGQILPDNFKIPFYITEYDADGNQAMDPGDSAAVTSDDATKGTVAADATVDATKVPATDPNGKPLDPAKVLLTGFLLGASTLGDWSATATYTHTDGTPAPAPVSIAFTTVSGPATVAGFGTGAAVPQ